MTEVSLSKWDKRYRDQLSPGAPCWLLDQHQHLLPARGRALDLACGLGANALLLARASLDTTAWDSSSVALDKLDHFARADNIEINTELRDVERHPPEPSSFDVIVVSHFLHRPLMPFLSEALRPGGLLFYQTFNRQKQSDRGPSNPEYLLAPAELLQHLSSLELVFYREDSTIGNPEQGLRDESYFIGRKTIDREAD